MRVTAGNRLLLGTARTDPYPDIDYMAYYANDLL
jgi:hypothetical protein